MTLPHPQHEIADAAYQPLGWQFHQRVVIFFIGWRWTRRIGQQRGLKLVPDDQARIDTFGQIHPDCLNRLVRFEV